MPRSDWGVFLGVGEDALQPLLDQFFGFLVFNKIFEQIRVCICLIPEPLTSEPALAMLIVTRSENVHRNTALISRPTGILEQEITALNKTPPSLGVCKWGEWDSNLRLLCGREVSHESKASIEFLVSTAFVTNTSKCRATRTIIGRKHPLILSINLSDSYDTVLLGIQHLKQRV